MLFLEKEGFFINSAVGKSRQLIDKLRSSMDKSDDNNNPEKPQAKITAFFK